MVKGLLRIMFHSSARVGATSPTSRWSRRLTWRPRSRSMPRGALGAEGSVTTGEDITGPRGRADPALDERAWKRGDVDRRGSTRPRSIRRASRVTCDVLAADDADRVDADRGADLGRGAGGAPGSARARGEGRAGAGRGPPAISRWLEREGEGAGDEAAIPRARVSCSRPPRRRDRAHGRASAADVRVAPSTWARLGSSDILRGCRTHSDLPTIPASRSKQPW